MCKPTPVIPIEFAGGMLIGYCPYEVYEHMAVAKSFLIPTMDGTPEGEKLFAQGIRDFKVSTLEDLSAQRDFLKEKGIIIR